MISHPDETTQLILRAVGHHPHGHDWRANTRAPHAHAVR
jgi:hypothetical protein